jgi:hypothetical protein
MKTRKQEIEELRKDYWLSEKGFNKMDSKGNYIFAEQREVILKNGVVDKVEYLPFKVILK